MSGLENFYPTGRHGLFLNNDMHDTMYMGIETAKYILNGNKSSRGWFKKIKKTLSDKLGPFHV
jgi:hypothetical protein